MRIIITLEVSQLEFRIMFPTILFWLYNFLGSWFLGAQILTVSYAKNHNRLMLYGMVKLSPIIQLFLFVNWKKRKINIYNILGQCGCYTLLLICGILKVLHLDNNIILVINNYGILILFFLVTLALITDAVVYIVRNGDY